MSVIATKYPFIGAIESRVGGRDENQDYAWYTDTPLGLLLVVCDGMGGGPGGRTASHTAVDTILTTLEDVSTKTLPADALRFAIESANERLYNMSLENAELRGMGTTVVAILISEENATVAHVGDTRLYQLRKGKVVFRTADHSQVAEMVRLGRLTEEEARNHPRSNIITRALGIRPLVEIEIDQISFQAQDRFILCSDGVWGMMPQTVLIKTLTRAMGIVELAELTVAEIDNKGFDNGGGHDNLTLVILDSQCGSDKQKADSPKVIHDTASQQEVVVHVVNPTPQSPRRGGWSYKHSFWTLLAVTVVGLAFFVKWVNEQSVSLVPLAQRTNTQPRIEPPTGHGAFEDISTNDTAHDMSDTGSVVPQGDVRGLIKDLPKVKRRTDPVVIRKVDSVISQLEELKQVQGRDRKEGSSRKGKIVKNIQKRLTSLSLPDREQIRARDKAVKMLNDSKVRGCDKRGKSSKESNEYIDEVKVEVSSITKP